MLRSGLSINIEGSVHVAKHKQGAYCSLVALIISLPDDKCGEDKAYLDSEANGAVDIY